MSNSKYVFIFFLVFLCVNVFSQSTIEKIVWSKKPIFLHLKTGLERIIIFPAKKITVEIDSRIDSAVNVTALDGILYIKALKNFPATRIRVIAIPTNQTFLFDLKASSSGGDFPLEIILPERIQNLESTATAQPGYIAMSRYAVQQIYAPLRIRKIDSRFSEVRLLKSSSRHLYRGGDLSAIPYRSWRAGKLYVTAIQLHNNSDYRCELDFRMIRGQRLWKSAVFQHSYLSAKNTKNDRTFLYLVSDKPFNQVNFAESLD